MRRMLAVGCALLVTPLLVTFWGSAFAQPFPSKPVTLIVPWPAGGSTDLYFRKLGEVAQRHLGQTLVIENRPGGSGMNGPATMAKTARPDGYTISQLTISAFRVPHMQKVDWDPISDFTYIIGLAGYTFGVVVKSDSPFKTFNDLLTYARANPGKLSYASAGAGSGTHLAGEMLKDRLKIDMLHVPYKGTGPAVTDLIGGQVQVMISTFASALPHVRSGRLRALGVTSAKRSPATPDVPTLIEAGVPDYDYSTWYALFMPAGTPGAIISKVNQVTRAALATEDLKQKFDAQGVEPWTNTPAELGAYVRAETEKWGKVVRAAGIPQL